MNDWPLTVGKRIDVWSVSSGPRSLKTSSPYEEGNPSYKGYGWEFRRECKQG